MTASSHKIANQWDGLPPAELLAMLKFQVELGADEALVDDPHAETVLESVVPAAPVTIIDVPPTDMTIADSSPQSSPDWQSCSTLDALKAAVSNWSGNGLKKTASNLVFGDGAVNADIMMIGKSPGADEDRQGKPFVGQSGKLLDKMLMSIGLDRQHVYMTNVLLFRPPGNRSPTPEEIGQFMPILRRHIQLVAPKIIVTLGEEAGKALMNTNDGMLKQRGSWTNYDIDDEQTPNSQQTVLMATLHPDHLLKTPGQKALAWHDLCQLNEKIAELGLR